MKEKRAQRRGDANKREQEWDSGVGEYDPPIPVPVIPVVPHVPAPVELPVPVRIPIPIRIPIPL